MYRDKRMNIFCWFSHSSLLYLPTQRVQLAFQSNLTAFILPPVEHRAPAILQQSYNSRFSVDMKSHRKYLTYPFLSTTYITNTYFWNSSVTVLWQDYNFSFIWSKMVKGTLITIAHAILVSKPDWIGTTLWTKVLEEVRARTNVFEKVLARPKRKEFVLLKITPWTFIRLSSNNKLCIVQWNGKTNRSLPTKEHWWHKQNRLGLRAHTLCLDLNLL